MTIQSVSTLVELGRPQMSFRADLGRVLRSQATAVVIGLVLFVVFAAVATFGSRRQAEMGNPEGRTIMLWVGTLFALGSLGLGVGLAARLQREKRTHLIVHDNGMCLVTVAGERIVRWSDLKEVVEVPATNAALLAGGALGFLFQKLLTAGATRRYSLHLRDGSQLLLPGHLENEQDLLARLRNARPS